MKHLALMFSIACGIPINSFGADNFETCRQKLIAAQKLDMLYDLQWDGKHEPKVVVGPTFFQVPIDAKEGLVETLRCFLSAGKDLCINFDVLDSMSGKRVGRYNNCRYRPD